MAAASRATPAKTGASHAGHDGVNPLTSHSNRLTGKLGLSVPLA